MERMADRVGVSRSGEITRDSRRVYSPKLDPQASSSSFISGPGRTIDDRGGQQGICFIDRKGFGTCDHSVAFALESGHIFAILGR
jgi:hypothetical protein